MIIPVIVSTLVLVGTGLLLALIFKKLGMLDMVTGYIGTSPGAMSAMIPLAVETEINPVLVVCFHFFRVVFVLLTAPSFLDISMTRRFSCALKRRGGSRQSSGSL
jgi:uncharacterized membrane protein AbrB (regulator of aidB expression)